MYILISTVAYRFFIYTSLPPFASTGDVRPEDLEEEIISTQPKADYQSIGDRSQEDVISVEITDKIPITEGEAPPPFNKSPPPSDQSAHVDKQEIS